MHRGICGIHNCELTKEGYCVECRRDYDKMSAPAPDKQEKSCGNCREHNKFSGCSLSENCKNYSLWQPKPEPPKEQEVKKDCVYCQHENIAIPGKEEQEKIAEKFTMAIARGWCSKENENKVVDVTLAKAIFNEIWEVYQEQILKEGK